MCMVNMHGHFMLAPLCGLCAQVLNLKEPVVDEVGFVYEKESIEGWLVPHGNRPVEAPIAGEYPEDLRPPFHCVTVSICRSE